MHLPRGDPKAGERNTMNIVIASGKGGTGKTTFAVNLAYALKKRGEKIRLLDCDVEEPNDHLFIKPTFDRRRVVTVPKPILDQKKCTGCGRCAQACNYNAIAMIKDEVLLFNELCHSCGVCSFVCPEGAFREEPVEIGTVEIASEREGLFFAHGVLHVGETLAPKVVESTKRCIDSGAVNIIDASPGTACPVVKALEGADVAVLVTEPTPFGLNDLKLAVSMTLKMGIPTAIVVNRSDGNDEIIRQYAQQVGVPIAGRIPFSRAYAQTYSRGDILVDHHEELRERILRIYNDICALRGSSVPPVPQLEQFVLTEPKTTYASAPKSRGDFKEITIISGKGGTGKTTITSCFAQLAQNLVLADNDVDAADLHLLFSPAVEKTHPFVGGLKAAIDLSKCIGCGACAPKCHFNAIRTDGPANEIAAKTCYVEQFSCEGCGLCTWVCPVDAITTGDAITGNWFDSATANGPMVHARLGIAEENSGRLVTQVRERAAQRVRELNLEKILADGPPGTGCPVIASISGTDLLVIVTEPTVSGVHDMVRVLDLASHFKVPSVVIINKADINPDQAKEINQLAARRNSCVVGSIPFDSAVVAALMAGKTVIDHGRSAAADAIREAWTAVQEVIR